MKTLVSYPKGLFGFNEHEQDPYAACPKFENPLFEVEYGTSLFALLMR